MNCLLTPAILRREAMRIFMRDGFYASLEEASQGLVAIENDDGDIKISLVKYDTDLSITAKERCLSLDDVSAIMTRNIPVNALMKGERLLESAA